MTATPPHPTISGLLGALRALKHERDTSTQSNAPRAIVELKRIVVGADWIIGGREVQTVAELVLRAQVLGILFLLEELCEAMRHASKRCQHLYTGRLHCFENVFTYLFDEVLPEVHRKRLCMQPDRAAYEAGIRSAQDVIARVAADPDFTHFLRKGCECSDAEHVQRACMRFQELLAYRFELVPLPDFSLLPAFDDSLMCGAPAVGAS